ncbi:MAG: hypothetical protein JXB15_18035 [Anaerolineales bacterium]|nr:hypothetical protein [Anaerolineales bacterium]
MNGFTLQLLHKISLPGRDRRPALWALINLTLCLALAASLVFYTHGLAQPDATTISLSPTPASLAGCGTVNVDIWVNDVANLYGADVQLTFDPNLLEVVDARPFETGVQILPVSTFLKPDWIIRNVADNTLGTIWYATTQLNPTLPVTGTGIIATITFRAKNQGTSALHFTYTKLATRDGDPIPGTPVDGSIQTTPPAAPALSISRLNATDARLSWTSVGGVADYHLYRDTAPYFTPADPAYQVTTGLSYDDLGVLGDTVVQHYYTVKAACTNGFKSDISGRVGEYDWALSSASTTNYSDVSMVFQNSSITKASHLATYIGSSVISVMHYNATTQTFDPYIVGAPSTDFDLTVGEFLFILTNNTAPASFPMVGNVPDAGSVSFSLVSGSPPKYNYLSLPLDRSDLTLASEIVSDVGGGVVALLAFRINTQTFDFYLPTSPSTDFSVVIGEPFVLLLTTGAPINWP